MLVGHYDSVPTGPGASDDGHAVAVLLETLRALRAGPPLERDVLFVFTDGEELGLHGARAFVAASPHKADIALALNFEARGTGGPAFMFQTSPGGSGLARELGRAAPYPMASSLLAELYRRMPNDTDLSELIRAGIPGMNFAYFDRSAGYHAWRDDAAALDPGSLQQQGSNALALARRFGAGGLDAAAQPGAAPEASWFHVTRGCLIWYPQGLDTIALACAAIGLVALIVRGRRRAQLRLRGVAIGAACLAVALVAWPVIAHIAWSRLVPGGAPANPTGDPAGASVLRAALLAGTIAAVLAVFRAGQRWAKIAELALGALGALIALGVVVRMIAPGGAYLLVWPSLFALIAAAALATAPPTAGMSARRTVLLGIGAVVPLWLIAPWIRLLFMLLGLSQVAVVAAVVVIALGFIAPALLVALGAWRWRAPAALAVTAIAALVAGVRAGGPSASHPASDSIAYAFDADSHRASWITDQRPVDAWTSRLIPDAAHRLAFDGFFPFTDWTFYQAPAMVTELAAPGVTVLDNRVEQGVRRLRLCVRPGGPAENVLVYLASPGRVRGVEIGGRRFDRQQTSPTARWAMRYAGAPHGGFEIALDLDLGAPIALRVVDQYYGLGRVAAPARPADLTQTPFGFGPPDQTYVGKTFAGLDTAAPASAVSCSGAHDP
jgi:hypothetical protein